MTLPELLVRKLKAGTLGILTVAAMMVAPTPATAQFGFTDTPAPFSYDQAELTFTAGSGVAAAWGNVAVGPYTGAYTSAPGSPFTLYCVDYNNAIRVGDTWTANFATIDAAGMGTTRLGLAGASDALTRYKKAIWLSAQFEANQTATSWSQIHAAIWSSASPGSSFAYSSYAGSWLAAADEAATNDFYGMDFSDWRVVTDVRAVNDPTYGGVQEYVARVTPEPSTWILLLSGLAGLGFVAYRRREQGDPI